MKLFKLTGVIPTLALVASLGMSAATSASAIGINPAGSGSFIYQLDNGNKLGLVGLQALTSESVTLGDLEGAVNSGSVFGWYFADPQSSDYGTPADRRGAWNGTPTEFTEFFDNTLSFSPPNENNLFDALWVEYTGTVVFNNGSGGTNTLSAGDATLSGDPLAPVPLPAAGWLLLAGLGGLGLAGRRKRKAA